MQSRQFIILKTDTGGSGVVKIEEYRQRLRISVNVKNIAPLRHDEVFKAYLLTDKEKNLFELLGALKGGQGVFDVKEMPVFGVHIYRKNIESGETRLEFWGSGQEDETEVKEKGKEYAQVMAAAPEKEKVERSYALLSSLDQYFVGEWKKINGYYSIYHYEIVQHVLAMPLVREKIMQYGYYLTCERKKGDETLIALAFPAKLDDEVPFEEQSDFAACVQSAPSSQNCYFAITVGIDPHGEFFGK
ncbi:MAG: hypothetical protein HFI90_09995 [Clostridia bacterium]|nr:hypothetical protein [Clostridia bacterium]